MFVLSIVDLRRRAERRVSMPALSTASVLLGMFYYYSVLFVLRLHPSRPS